MARYGRYYYASKSESRKNPQSRGTSAASFDLGGKIRRIASVNSQVAASLSKSARATKCTTLYTTVPFRPWDPLVSRESSLLLISDFYRMSDMSHVRTIILPPARS